MSLLGEVLRDVREAYGWTGRELGRKSGLSHTQVARIESGAIASPAADTLVSLARALELNPRPLMILAGHLSGDEARTELRPMFRDHAELLEEWGEWAHFTVDEARVITNDAGASDADLQLLAADVLRAGESEENLFYPEDAAVLAGGGDEKLRGLLSTWRYLDDARSDLLLDYASKLHSLQDLEFHVEQERLRLDAASILPAGEDTAASPAMFGEDFLREQGFTGFIRVLALQAEATPVPNSAGVYAVVRRGTSGPEFLERSVGGHFKGKDPTVPVERLHDRWVDGAATVYIGRAQNLRQRLQTLSRYGHGEPVGHWGGRFLWQLADHPQLLVCWLQTDAQVQRESDLITDFVERFDALPFANINQPRGEVQP